MLFLIISILIIVLFVSYAFLTRTTVNNYIYVNYSAEESIVDAIVADYECAIGIADTCIYSSDEYDALVEQAYTHAQHIQCVEYTGYEGADVWYAAINAQVDAQYAMYEQYADIQDSIYSKHRAIDKYMRIVDKHDLKDMRNCTTKRKYSGIHKTGKIDRRRAVAEHKRIDKTYAMLD